MRTDEAVSHFGSVIKLAKILGVHRSAVYQWGERVPKGRAFELQILTGGTLRANGPAEARQRKRTAA